MSAEASPKATTDTGRGIGKLTAPPEAPTRPAPILIVDDNTANLKVLYYLLTKQGYELLQATSGKEALELAQAESPALILLDIMMPEMDGFEVCQQLKANAETRDIAVIFLTALDEIDHKVRGLELGAVDYLTKPFQAKEIIARVDTHLKIRELEQSLAIQNRRLKAVNQQILDCIGAGVYALTDDGTITFANPAVTELTGWPQAEFEGKAIARLGLNHRADGSRYPPEDNPLYGSLRDGQTHHVEGDLFWRKDGESFLAEYTTVPIYEQGALAGAVTILKDITARVQAAQDLEAAHEALLKSHDELKQTQQQLVQAAKLESVGQLAAGAAHEVKNPLAIIQMGVDYLARATDMDSTAKSVLTDMEDAVSRADTVIKGLLDFARVKSPKMALENLNRVIEKSIRVVRHELTQRRIKLDMALADDLLPVHLDQDKMQQVLINLTMNAAQAMRGPGELTIRTRNEPPLAQPGADDRRVIAEVCDTGPGIPEEALGRLFDPFFTTKALGEGTGLGLFVTHKIIELHGGTIKIANRVKGGAKVTITFKGHNHDEGKNSRG
ncbi:MAG: ATP-binding response regulator [Gammaproteobacteria bacterium]